MASRIRTCEGCVRSTRPDCPRSRRCAKIDSIVKHQMREAARGIDRIASDPARGVRPGWGQPTGC